MFLIKKYKSLPVQIKASFWFLICAFLQKGISMITTPIFTRLLSTQEYGQYSVFNSWLSIVTILVSLNLSAGVFTQGLVKFEADRASFASAIQGLETFLNCIWTIIYLVGRRFWNDFLGLTTVQVLSMLVMIWTTSVFCFWADTKRVEYKYKSLVVITLIVSIAKPIVGIFLVINANDKVTARILGLALVELIGYSGMFFLQMRKGKLFFSQKYWKYALAFNLPLIPHYLSQVVLNSADRIMISNMVGDSEAGIYSLAYSLSSIMLLFNNSLMQTLSPWIYKKIKGRKINEISTVAYLSLTLIAIVNLLLILVAPEAVAIFAPKAYHTAIWTIPPVAMSVYFMFCYDLFAKFAFYYEKTKLIMCASVIGAVLNIVLNYIFINAFGYVAAGYTTLVCYVIYSVAHYNLMNIICEKYCDKVKPYEFGKLLMISVLFVITGIILLLTYNHALIRYGLIAFSVIALICNRKTIVNLAGKILNLKQHC